MLIISKVLLLLSVEISGKMIQNEACYMNSKISLFNLSICLLTSVYSLLFDGYFNSSIKIHYFLTNIVILSSLVIVIYKLFDNQKQSMIAQTNHKLLQNEIEFQKKNYKNLISNENETRKMRHNNKHLLLLLKEYSKAKDLENIEKTLDNQLDHLENLKYFINTGNESINLIVSHYLPLIKDKKIDLICNFCEEQPNIDKLDFYIIFGNILENAIEHCESDKVKKINIETGKSVDGRYYFKITNSINTLEKIDLTTSKKNSINHGYGIQSINQLVKRNNGVINFIQSRNSFSSIVIFPI